MELLDKTTFLECMDRLFARLDELQSKKPDLPTRPIIGGKPLLDNQEVCQMLQISKRTLQRYRDSGTLPSHMVYHKTWYKESEVITFMETHFTQNLKRKRIRQSKKNKG